MLNEHHIFDDRKNITYNFSSLPSIQQQPTTHETRLVFMFSLISHSGDDSHTRCRLDDVHDRLMFDNKLFSGREFS